MTLREALLKFVDPRFVVAMLVMMYYGWAFYTHPNDQTLTGNLIAGFNIAIGFYLGNAKSTDDARATNKAAYEAITATANANAGESK